MSTLAYVMYYSEIKTEIHVVQLLLSCAAIVRRKLAETLARRADFARSFKPDRLSRVPVAALDSMMSPS